MGEATPEEPAKRRSFFAELPFLLFWALVVAVLIKTFLIQPFFIPSRSMVPTLLVDDRVMVSKVNYRVGEPQRNDVVVFENPWRLDEPDENIPERVVRAVLEALGIRTSSTDDLIKRIIAVEGDTVEIRANQLILNGEPLDEPYLAEGSVMPDMESRTIPSGHLWMMGDNRSESSDSRVFGPVPETDIIGEAFVRIWPLSRLGGL
ncbi:MAG: signal peptidase I [Acidimicrobiia bacterium]|nr:signal peptidase I [Acidimicrobiia bacterium]